MRPLGRQARHDGLSIYIAAHDADDAHALFEKCMALAATGEHAQGQLVWADPPRGCAQLYTHMSRPETTTYENGGAR